MAFLYITEHREPKLYNGQLMPVVHLPPLATQKLANDGTSVASSAFNADTVIIGVRTDSICSIAVSATPGAATAATTSDARLAANSTEYFHVRAGDKLSVVLNT